MTEHIPLVKNATKLQIPFLCGAIKYGDKSQGFEYFSQFPASMGLNIDTIEISKEEDVALLQSWLLFGLLAEAFGRTPMHFASHEFIRQTDVGVHCITTEVLPKYFYYWLAWRIYLREEEEREILDDHAKSLDQCLTLANTVFQRVALQDAETQDESDATYSARRAVLLSIAVTAEWICDARKQAVKMSHSNINISTLRWYFPYMRTALLRAGWCVGETAELMANQNTSCLFYFAMMDRTKTGKNHSHCDSKEGCKALRVDYSNYKLLHVSTDGKDCGCKKTGPRIREIAAVLERGSIPLVTESAPGVCTVLEHNSSNPIRYVAISHVWSDGLGNPKENRLNSCTFRYIQDLVNKLYGAEEGPVPFWIDTMCIPPQEHHTPMQKEMRKKGITQMATTYARADKVLVLDRSLQMQQSSIDLTEMTVRIRQAPWTTRLWTLQEGRLAKGIYFQFQDRAISVEYLEDTVKNDNNWDKALGCLQGLSDEAIASNECATRLLQAFASLEPAPITKEYAQRPPQDDEDEEEIRLCALAVVQEYSDMSDLRHKWESRLDHLNLHQASLEDVKHLSASVRILSVDFVKQYGMSIIRHIKGYGYSAIIHDGLAHTAQQTEYPSAGHMTDLIMGFQGRTTTRLEDETICLGILLQIRHLEILLEIEPLHWRWGHVLREMDVGRVVLRCHEKRMKALLVQIETKASRIGYEQRTDKTKRINALPQSMVFWNVPRLGPLGWNWAPLSFLDAHLGYVLRIEKFGVRTPFGLEVDWSGYKINGISGFSRSLEGAHDAVLVIHPDTSRPQPSHGWYPFRRSWERFRLRQNDRTTRKEPKQVPDLISWAKSGILQNMAVLIDDDAVLVHEYAMRNQVHLTKHVALVERATVDSALQLGLCEIHVWATWISGEKWVVG